MNEFAVISCYFNPCGYQNRKVGFTRFVAGLKRQDVPLWIIEATLPGHERLVTAGDRVVHVQLPEHDWLWQKERLLNLLLRQLPPTVTKVAWVDGDLLFVNDDWPRLACDALDTWSVIQLFDFAYWLGPNDEVMSWEGKADRRASLASIAMHYPAMTGNFSIGTPGFAWAARRSLLDRHGFYENDISGGNDSVMAAGFYGWWDHNSITRGTKELLHDAQTYMRLLHEDVKGFVGYIPSPVQHLWHGHFKDRTYVERTKRICELGFDPRRDLETDPTTGLLRWSQEAKPELRDFLRSYFHSRREDASV